jgi:hypothetical protein
MKDLYKYLVAIPFLILGCAGLAMSLCGGFFTLGFLWSRGSDIGLLWLISVPSLILGGVITYFAFKAVKASLR